MQSGTDHYLGLLGIGAGEWNVENSEIFPQKFALAVNLGSGTRRSMKGLSDSYEGKGAGRSNPSSSGRGVWLRGGGWRLWRVFLPWVRLQVLAVQWR